MRTSSLLDALMPKTRQAILGAVLLRTGGSWYLRELAEHLGVPASSLQRELASLTAAGILKRHIDGNRSYYQADDRCPILGELRAILIKTAGVVGVLQAALKRLRKRIKVAFVYGSMATGSEASASDIDLMVIGEVGLADVSVAVRPAEERLGRSINAVVLSADEARQKYRARQHFLTTVLQGDKLFVIGQKDELAEAVE